MAFPRHVAQIVEGGKMGPGGDVGEREMVARQPLPPLGQIADIVEVIVDVLGAGPDRVRVGLPQAQEPLHDLLVQKVAGDLAVELGVEPGDHAAGLGAGDGIGADERLVGVDFLQELRDHGGAGEHGAVGLDQHRHLARRVDGEKRLPALPNLLDLEVEFQALFLEDDPDLARARRQPEVVQGPHGRLV